VRRFSTTAAPASFHYSGAAMLNHILHAASVTPGTQRQVVLQVIDIFHYCCWFWEGQGRLDFASQTWLLVFCRWKAYLCRQTLWSVRVSDFSASNHFFLALGSRVQLASATPRYSGGVIKSRIYERYANVKGHWSWLHQLHSAL